MNTSACQLGVHINQATRHLKKNAFCFFMDKFGILVILGALLNVTLVPGHFELGLLAKPVKAWGRGSTF